MKRTAVALISGGLDSILAARVVMDQGFDVTGLYFTSVFSKSYGKEDATHAARVARSVGIGLRVMDLGQEYIELIRNPRHGYGKNINPCIDCKIFMLTKAKAVMEELGSPFIITGEVLGQRPMSQRRDTLNVIERDSGLKGMVLRPLSARLLPPTKAETEGIINREKLLDISGRSRSVQLALAAQYGIEGFSTPAGGCLLTDENFARRLRELFEHKIDVAQDDIRLLTMGRHFRLPSGAKVVVGRNKQENEQLSTFGQSGMRLLRPSDFPGPVAVLTDERSPEDAGIAAGLILKYSREIPGKTRTVVCEGKAVAPTDEYEARPI